MQVGGWKRWRERELESWRERNRDSLHFTAAALDRRLFHLPHSLLRPLFLFFFFSLNSTHALQKKGRNRHHHLFHSLFFGLLLPPTLCLCRHRYSLLLSSTTPRVILLHLHQIQFSSTHPRPHSHFLLSDPPIAIVHIVPLHSFFRLF